MACVLGHCGETGLDGWAWPLPAAGAPLIKGRSLAAKRRVLAVAGVEPRLVGQPAEELGLHIGQKRGEPRGVALRVPNAARKP